MGLLNANSLNEWATAIPDRAREMYAGLLDAPRQVKQLFDPAYMAKVAAPRPGEEELYRNLDKGGLLNFSPDQKSKMMQLAMDVMPNPMAMMGKIVYHGSPHKFAKFDMSKIGTGEGAQAYGHGLYFAENPSVARSYSKADDYWHVLSDGGIGNKDGATLKAGGESWTKRLSALNPDEQLLAQKRARYTELRGQINSQFEKFKNPRGNAKPVDPILTREFYTLQDELGPLTAKVEEAKKANFYKVDIPDEAIPRMLDWDKPLSEQTPEIQNFAFKAAKPLKNEVKAFSKNPINGDLTPQNIYDLTGADLHRVLSNSDEFLGLSPGSRLSGKPGWTQELVMQKMKDMGIPGIRYLDGNSRGVGGTSNYVLFDDQLARILEVNGHPTGLLPWADDLAKKAKK